jgi:hypothetical protein
MCKIIINSHTNRSSTGRSRTEVKMVISSTIIMLMKMNDSTPTYTIIPINDVMLMNE